MSPADLARRSQLGAVIFALSLFLLCAALVLPGTQWITAFLAGLLTARGWRMMRKPPKTSKWWGP
jgi:glucose uptake protein GlcU